MKELYVVNCCRTAIGSFGGSLKNPPAVDMGAIVVKEALKRANVAPENVDELMFGCILTAGQGQNPARQVSVKAGIPYSVPAYTVGMVCGSGMKSVIEAGRAILAGDADIVVYDPGASHVLHGADMLSKAGYTPFEGFRTNGGVSKVYLRGQLQVDGGKVVGGKMGEYLKRGKCAL